MKTKILGCLILIAGLVLGYALGTYKMVAVHAAPYTSVIPKAWGTCKGSTLVDKEIFEASDGTVRIVEANGNVVEEFDRK